MIIPIPVYMIPEPYKLPFAFLYLLCATWFFLAILRDWIRERRQQRYMRECNKALMKQLTNGEWK